MTMTSDSNLKFGSDSKRRALFEKLLRQVKLGSTSPSTIPRRPAASTVPLSFAQERLWFLDQLEPNSAVYNVPMGLSLKGALNLSVLHRCLEEIVRRHEALRTRFEIVDGHPVQAIEPFHSPEMPLIDLSNLPKGQRKAEARRLCTEEAQCPFDLTQGPVLRAKLFRLEPTEHLLLLNMHHIASDGWSVGVLLRELGSLYQAFSEEKPSPLPELPVQYADFAVWQREWLQGEVLEKQLSYWRKQLEGAPALLELPTDRPRPATRSYRGALETVVFPQLLLRAVKALSQQEGASLFMTLLAAFQTLLWRHSGQEDIVVGSPIAGRNRVEIEGLIGFFVNTLVLRSDLSGNPTFRELLRRVREVTLGAYAHQDLPFEKLVEELKPERNLSYSALCQVVFGLQNTSAAPEKLGKLSLSTEWVPSGTAKYDLSLYMTEDAGGLTAEVEYNPDLFERETILRLLNHLRTLLEGVVANPEARTGELALLSLAERHQLLVEWSGTEADYPRDSRIHELFEQQVERTPDAVAAVFENQQLTYLELNRRANQLAHRLRKFGVGPDVLVGLAVERSLEMLVGLLGILKAGGAYLPLDPSHPRDRLAFLLEDAQPLVLLIQERLRGQFPPHKAEVVCLDGPPAHTSRGEDEGPVIGNRQASDLAYVLYTSGSTGVPKGVLGSIRATMNRFEWMWRTYPFSPDDTCCQKTALTFADSVWEIFGPLLRGVRTVIVPDDVVLDPDRFLAMLARFQVTRIVLVPSLLRVLLDAAPNLGTRVPKLRLWSVSGEALPVDLARRFRDAFPKATLLNIYGSTEVTADVTCYEVARTDDLHSVPIGKPISNVQIAILDHRMNPVPALVEGQIYVGGDCLSHGYWQRPDLTAQRFIRNPFRPDQFARLYATGDRGRFLPDGNVEFLGRIDRQVKIRGFRIELGEIESVLAGHPGVRETVVVAREDVFGDKRLVAYLTAKDSRSPDVSELRGLLQSKLPDYMLPAAFVRLPSFPLTPSGKIDRKALPAPESGKIETEQGYVAPRTYAEQVLCNIWREVLNLKRVGVRDNFFDLGGHSLLAVRLIGEINRSLKVNLHVPAFFQNPTIERLAMVLDQEHLVRPEPQLISLQPGRSAGSLFLLEPGIGLCRLAELFDTGPASLATVAPLPSAAFRAASLDKLADLPSLEELAAPHTALIRSHPHSGPCFLVGHSFGGLLAFEVAHQLQGEGRRVEMIFLLDTWAEGPAWWRKLKVLTFNRARESLKFRANRLWKGAIARTAQAKGQLHIISKPPNPLDAGSEDVNLPFGEVPWEIMSKVYQNARKKYRMCPLASRAILFRARDSAMAHLYAIDGTLGWSGLFNGGLEVVDCPGDHFTLLKAPHLQFLVQQFEKRLEHLHPASRT